MTDLMMETNNIIGFSTGDEVFAIIKGLVGFKGLPKFFTQQMAIFFNDFIDD